METIEFNKVKYPKFQSEGNASQFAIPFAKHFCKGIGYDIGCNRIEWCLDGAIPIDPLINKEYDALCLPQKDVDFIFSSHCLEHILDWVNVMDFWYDTLKEGGILFLYLPDFSQEYWRPWNNKKHKNILTSWMVKEYMEYKGYKNIFCSGIDFNNSFMIIGEK